MKIKYLKISALTVLVYFTVTFATFLYYTLDTINTSGLIQKDLFYKLLKRSTIEGFSVFIALLFFVIIDLNKNKKKQDT